MTTNFLTADHAAKAIALAINTIDALADVAAPVYRAGQQAGRICKPILQDAFAKIDWHEALRITVLGLVITAVATYRVCRWAGPALIRTSAALGRWYAGWLVNHSTPTGDPPAPEAAPVSAEGVAQADAPEPQENEPTAPAPTAALPEPSPAAQAAKGRRRTRRQPRTTA